MPRPWRLLETQGAILWPSHNDGRLSFVVNALGSHRKLIRGCRAKRTGCPERCRGRGFSG